MEDKKFSVGDKVAMKKEHPCGSNEWEIIRTGADIKIQCIKCGRIIMMTRSKFLKGLKNKLSK